MIERAPLIGRLQRCAIELANQDLGSRTEGELARKPVAENFVQVKC